jgi:hypothetical protein
MPKFSSYSNGAPILSTDLFGISRSPFTGGTFFNATPVNIASYLSGSQTVTTSTVFTNPCPQVIRVSITTIGQAITLPSALGVNGQPAGKFIYIQIAPTNTQLFDINTADGSTFISNAGDSDLILSYSTNGNMNGTPINITAIPTSFGSMAFQNADNVNITGGDIGGLDTLESAEFSCANVTITGGTINGVTIGVDPTVRGINSGTSGNVLPGDLSNVVRYLGASNYALTLLDDIDSPPGSYFWLENFSDTGTLTLVYGSGDIYGNTVLPARTSNANFIRATINKPVNGVWVCNAGSMMNQNSNNVNITNGLISGDVSVNADATSGFQAVSYQQLNDSPNISGTTHTLASGDSLRNNLVTNVSGCAITVNTASFEIGESAFFQRASGAGNVSFIAGTGTINAIPAGSLIVATENGAAWIFRAADGEYYLRGDLTA